MLNALQKSKSITVGDGVVDLRLSPSGEQFAVCTESSTESSVVSIFNSDDLELVGEFPTEAAKCVCYSPDGRLLSVQRDKQAIVLLDTTTLAVTAEISTSRIPRVRCLAFSHDGTMLAGAGFSEPFLNKGIVIVWNAATGEVMHEINEDVDLVPRMEFYSDDKSLFIQGYKTGFLVLDTETWTEISRHEEFLLEYAGISPDGRKLLVSRRDGKIDLYDTRTSSCEKTLKSGGEPPIVLAWAPDLRTFIAGFQEGSIYAWDSQQDEQLALAVTDSEVRSLAFSPNGRTFVSGHASGEVAFWDLAEQRQSKSKPTPTRSIVEITETKGFKPHRGGSTAHFSPDGSRIITGGFGDCLVRVWETRTLEKQWSARTKNAAKPRCAPDGKSVFCCYDRNRIRQWDMETKEIIRDIEFPEYQAAEVIDFTPDGKTMITFGTQEGLHGMLVVWDVASWEAVMEITTKRQKCWNITLTRDGKYFYSAATGAIRKWGVVTTDVAASAPVGPQVPVWAVAVTPHGESVYTAAGGTAQSCEIRCWTSDLELRGAILAAPLDEGVVSLAMSPDGQTLASGSSDKLIRLWDVNTHELKAVLRGHKQGVSSIDFSPDGKRLVTASCWDSHVKTWDVSSVC